MYSQGEKTQTAKAVSMYTVSTIIKGFCDTKTKAFVEMHNTQNYSNLIAN